MGEAKRRKNAVLNGPCPCGSSKPARQCCAIGGVWHKPAVALGLKALPPASTVEKCYMNALGSCEGGISAEHLISDSVIKILMADGDFSVSGLPWLAEGEEKIIGPSSFVANCLCRITHNSALSPLDAAAEYFFAALKSCLDRKAQDARYIISGHDLERWLLKTAKAIGASGNFAQGRTRLSGAFSNDVAILDMLDEFSCWPEEAGLYCVMNTGDVTQNHNRFQLQPYTNAHGAISGLGVNIMGLGFIFMLEPLDLGLNPHLRHAKYRPGEIAISYPSSLNAIAISWGDDRRHESLSMRFMGTAA